MAVPKTFTAGEQLFADDLNGNFEALDTRLVTAESDIDQIQADLPDASSITEGTLAQAHLPTGTIVQAVEATKTGVTTITATSYVATGLSGAITPRSSSSKIWVVVSLLHDMDPGTNDDINCYIRIVRNGTEVKNWNEGFNANTGKVWVSTTHSVLDSPASASPVTYTVEAKISSASDSREMHINWAGGASTITLFEVTA